MEENDMTNEVFRTLMQAIITIIKDASDKEDAIAKIENLLKKEKQHPSEKDNSKKDENRAADRLPVHRSSLAQSIQQSGSIYKTNPGGDFIATSEAQRRAKKKWEAKAVNRISVKLHKVNDADILEYINRQKNKNGAIKSALRLAIKNEQEN